MESADRLCDHFVLNNRWWLDASGKKLTDLEYRVDDVTLTSAAARILVVLARSPFIVLPRTELFAEAWRLCGGPAGCDLDQVIGSLTQKFAALPPGRPFLKIIPRIGYCLFADVRRAEEDRRAMMHFETEEGRLVDRQPSAFLA